MAVRRPAITTITSRGATPDLLPQIVGVVIRYVGRVDGRPCVLSLTREGAAHALLRRILPSP